MRRIGFSIICAMGIYAVQRDDYAGWSGAGRNFLLFGIAAGAIAAAGWAATHGHLAWLRPTDAADQLFLSAMTWVCGGVFVLMAIATMGSLLLSDKARGSVVVDDLGVERQIGGRSRRLAWPEIEGFVVNPAGGVTLVAGKVHQTVEIPRFLDDYRGCIAEIKARGVGALPSSRLKKGLTRWQAVLVFCSTLTWSLARDARDSHAMRLLSLCLFVAFWIWLIIDQKQTFESEWSRWIGRIGLIVMLAWLLLHMAHTW